MTDENKIVEEEVKAGAPEQTHSAYSSLGTKEAIRSDRIIQVIAVALLVLTIIGMAGIPQQVQSVIFSLRNGMTEFLSWWFVIGAFACLCVVIYVAFSKFGKIRLGGPNERPQFSMFSWVAMLYATGQGVGMIFWGIAEPIFMAQGDVMISNGVIGAQYGAESAVAWTWFHWGIPAWAIYTTTALVLGYARHNKHKNSSFRAAMDEILPKNPTAKNVLGIIIEVLVILTTVFGISTSLGTGAMQFNTGFKQITGMAEGIGGDTMGTILVILLFGAIASLSVFLGVNKGVKNISNINAWGSILLVAGALILGPTLYLIYFIFQSIGVYLNDFISMSFFTEPHIGFGGEVLGWEEGTGAYENSFTGPWNVFIWSWTFAFSVFTGQFVATISRGRTLREFALGVTFIPFIVVVLWSGVLGGAALYYDQLTTPGGITAWDPMGALTGEVNAGDVLAATNAETTGGLFATLSHMPGGMILTVLAVLLIAGYLVTTVDSSVLALSDFVATATKPSRIFKVALAVAMVGLAAALFAMGGGDALNTVQTGCLVGAVPFTIILLFAVINFFRTASEDPMLPGHEAELEAALASGYYDQDEAALNRHAGA